MKRRRVIYEGKAKILYEGTEPGTVIQYFKDDATAGNGAKKDTIEGKGVLNNRISEYLMTQLAGHRRAHPFRAPPEHARAADQGSRDHSPGSGGAQCRRRLHVQAAGDRGRHRPAPLHHRILLQE